MSENTGWEDSGWSKTHCYDSVTTDFDLAGSKVDSRRLIRLRARLRRDKWVERSDRCRMAESSDRSRLVRSIGVQKMSLSIVFICLPPSSRSRGTSDVPGKDRARREQKT